MSDEPIVAPTHYRKSLTEAEKDRFAYELALGYYEVEELRRVFKLLVEPFKNYMDSENMKTRVMQHKRAIDESPDALRIHARRAARKAIDNLALLIDDKEAPAKTRMEAGRQLREYAMVADKEALADPNAGGPTIIRTNLDLKNAQGVYQIKAEEIEAQEAENAVLAVEHGAVQPGAENTPPISADFADLLGVPE